MATGLRQSEINVYTPNGEIVSVVMLNGSQVEYNLMGETKATIHTETPEPLEIPIGSYIMWKTEKFWLVKSADIVKKNSRSYEYTITFLPLSAKLQYILFVEQADDKQNRRVAFSATMKPIEFARQIVASIQEKTGEIVDIGNITAEDIEQTITFDSNSIYDSLNMISDAYRTEWLLRYEGGKYYLDLGVIEYDKDIPLQLSYGKGNGFLSGVSFSNGSEPTIRRVYVQGGVRNIDFNTYVPQIDLTQSEYHLRHSNNLLLPYIVLSEIYLDGELKHGSYSIQYDGKNFGSFDYIRINSLSGEDSIGFYRYPADNGFNPNSQNVRTYRLDVNEANQSGKGAFIENTETRNIDGVFSEVAYKNEDIYPQFECVTDICTIQEGTGDDLGVFTVYHQLRELATAKEDKTFVVLDCIKNGDNYELVPNGLAHHSNDTSGYISLGYHSFTAGERIEVIQSIKLLSTNTFVNGQNINYLFYAARLVDNNTIYNYGQYGSRGDDKLLDDGKVVAVVVSTALGSGPYTFNYDLFSTDSDVRVETQKENFPNYQECIIPGEIPSVVFQSGMLAGKEFKLRTTQDGDLDNGMESTIDDDKIVGFAFVKKSGNILIKTYEDGKLAITDETTHVAFRMLREEIDNIVMADNDSGFIAKEFDRFAVFNVKLPYVYLANAEVALLKSAVKYMYENENPNCNIDSSIDELFLHDNYDKFLKIRLGEYVHNNDFDVDVRIVQIIQSLSNELEVKLSFSESRKKENLGSKILREM